MATHLYFIYIPIFYKLKILKVVYLLFKYNNIFKFALKVNINLKIYFSQIDAYLLTHI